MFTIQVIEMRNGRPLKNARVQAFFEGWFRGHTSEEWTNEEGEVTFDYDNGKGEIYVNGKRAFEGEIYGHRRVYV